MVTKIGSVPFPRGPTRLRKFRQVSESPKRHWMSVPSSFSLAVFDPDRGQYKLCAERLFLWHPQIPGCGRCPILESFFGSAVSALYGRAVISPWLERNGVVLLQGLVQNSSSLWALQAFELAQCDWRFSSEAGAQSSSEGRMKLHIQFNDGSRLSPSANLVVTALLQLNCRQF